MISSLYSLFKQIFLGRERGNSGHHYTASPKKILKKEKKREKKEHKKSRG